MPKWVSAIGCDQDVATIEKLQLWDIHQLGVTAACLPGSKTAQKILLPHQRIHS